MTEPRLVGASPVAGHDIALSNEEIIESRKVAVICLIVFAACVTASVFAGIGAHKAVQHQTLLPDGTWHQSAHWSRIGTLSSIGLGVTIPIGLIAGYLLLVHVENGCTATKKQKQAPVQKPVHIAQRLAHVERISINDAVSA